MEDIHLTEHFRLSEFVRSRTAERHGIDNTPTSVEIGNLRRLCEEILEPLREFAGRPVVITSGFRCPRLNHAVGGTAHSQHMRGEAADIRLPMRDNGAGIPVPDYRMAHQYLEFILENCDFDQLIWERDEAGNRWIHVSCRAIGNRGEYIRL